MGNRRVFVNAGMSVGQVVVSGIVLFILYRYLLHTIGVERFGIWSIVLATTVVTRFSDLGFSGSVVKYVAKYIARTDIDRVRGVLQTAALSIGALIGLILLMAYPLLRSLLGLIVPTHGLAEARAVLPYALISMWMTGIAGVFQAGLDGCQRIDLRCLLLIGSGVLYLLLALLLVPSYALTGLAYAQMIQAAGLLIGSWLMLRSQLRFLPVLPYQWRRALFTEMVRYGVSFQVPSVVGIFFEPVTKILASRFGGLALVGYYEMASRMILQLRSILISANQVLVPVIAGLQEERPTRVQLIYRDSYRLVLYFAMPYYASIAVATPLISHLWIGHYEPMFVNCANLLVAGWFLNNLAAPAFFANVGTGRMRWNVVGQLTTGVLNLCLGMVLGHFGGGIGVVAAWVIALVSGSIVTLFAYHVEQDIPFAQLFPWEDRWLLLATSMGILLSVTVYYQLGSLISMAWICSLSLLTFAVTLFLPLWLHPMRSRLFRWVGDGVSGVGDWNVDKA